jgi:hypothetical protein
VYWPQSTRRQHEQDLGGQKSKLSPDGNATHLPLKEEFLIFYVFVISSNFASGNVDTDGAKWRDQLAVKIIAEDVSKAQRRTRVCLSSAYQDCD